MKKNSSARNAGIVLAAALVATAGLTIGTARAESLTGTVKVDGSSTVFPISEAVAEEFQGENPKVRVTVGVSGTGGGFKRFCVGETDISDASRPIKPTEVECAQTNGVNYVELPVAYDGISIVANPNNKFLSDLTVAELKRIWSADGGVTTWKDVRPEWPADKIALYGPGTDSGTFDYFIEVIVGKDGSVRPDFTASEDDNVLVQGVAGDPNGLGFFGFAYYVENTSKLKLVGVDGGKGIVEPSTDTINNGTYAPLSRPIFIYVSEKAAKRPEVDAFVQFYMKNAATLSAEVGYVALPARVYELAIKRFTSRKTGSAFAEGHGGSLESLLEKG